MKTMTFISNKLPFFSLLGFMASVLATSTIVFAAPPSTFRASVSSGGAEANSFSFESSLSGNGRFVTFVSDASNLVTGDTNGFQDIFIHNLKTGEIKRVSVHSTGAESNHDSYTPAISANGRYVAFTSGASNLVPGDDNGAEDIFLHDLKSGTTQLVSLSSEGIAGNNFSSDPVLAAKGRFVVFSSDASNLVPGDTNGVGDIFIRDLKTGTTKRISVDSSGNQGNAYSASPAFSANGRFVAFVSAATNLVAGDNNGLEDVFVHDLKTGVTARVSISSAGEEASISGYDPMDYCAGAWFSIYSGSPSISADGRFVAFDSDACNLVEGDTNTGFYSVGYDYPGTDIFIHDRQTGETKLVSVDNSGAQLGLSYEPSISNNGRFVTFTSLYGGELNLYYYLTTNIVVHDLKTGTTQIVSVDPKAADDIYFGSYDASISATGKFISFSSDSPNLVPGDNNNSYDVFVSRRW
jgi:Tol biopolymer transport system component